jgi:hypothetical protein
LAAAAGCARSKSTAAASAPMSERITTSNRPRDRAFFAGLILPPFRFEGLVGAIPGAEQQ